MRKWLVGIGVAVLATAVALGIVRFTSLEGWAARQPGVERVHIVELTKVDQIEAQLDDAASARAFADALGARSGAEPYRAILTWRDADVERSILVEPRTHEEAWRLASASLPGGVTAQRVGLHDGRIDAVEYTAGAITPGLPISSFVSSLKLGPVTIQSSSTSGLNDALGALDGFRVAGGAWTEEGVVDIAARLVGVPGVKVVGQRVEIGPGHTMGEDEALLRELARGTGTVSYGSTFEADLSVEDCARAAAHLQGELFLDWRCGDVLEVTGPGDAVRWEMAGLLAVAGMDASLVRRSISGDEGSLRVDVPDDVATADLVDAIRAIGWEGEAVVDVRGELFRTTATGSAQWEQHDGGPVVEAWDATAEG